MSMGLFVNLTGTFVSGRVLWANYTIRGIRGWYPALGAWVKNGSTWQQFYQAQVAASCSPSTVVVPVLQGGLAPHYVYSPDGPSSPVTATASGGVGPYSYSWAITSGASFFSVSSPGAQTTTFVLSTTFNSILATDPVNGTATVTVTDSGTGLTATATVALTT